MQTYDLYKDIAERTQGDLYIGVVGPVRSGKSTFIARFIEKLVLPGVENPHVRDRILDEMPQSGSGRTVMTTKPTFIPSEAAQVYLTKDAQVRVRLVDSVGYLIDGALGAQEGDTQRMVGTPWAAEALSFEQAAEIGTRKVIGTHSTIGVVVTGDGSATEFSRAAYLPAEMRAVEELKQIGKPFVIVLNTVDPSSGKAQTLVKSMEADYGVPVLAMNAAAMDEADIQMLIGRILDCFPVANLRIHTPEWLGSLDENHWLIENLTQLITNQTPNLLRIGEVDRFIEKLEENEFVECLTGKVIDHGCGCVDIHVNLKDGLFNRILAEQCGTEIRSNAHLLSLMRELVEAKKQYDQVSAALASVRESGYGVVTPQIEEMSLQEPQIMQQGGRFGVRLRASAPSLHMVRVNVQTEVSPVIGTEQQSEEMIRYLMEEFDQDPKKIWQSNLFGKPLSDLVREGLANKLMHMPENTQEKLRETLEKIINEGNGTMVCILL